MATLESVGACGRQDSGSNNKPIVAVDLDEVLGGFLSSLTVWHNRIFNTSYTLDDYTTYSFKDLWGGTNEQSVAKVHDYFKSPEFLTGVLPIAPAFNILQQFTSSFEFVVVTSRQTVIQEETKQWIATHYPNIFSSVQLGNHYDLASPDPDAPGTGNIVKRSKPKMCQDIQATLLIDDSVKYAYQCAVQVENNQNQETSMRSVILFGAYGWNEGSHIEHMEEVLGFVEKGIVKRATTWTEVGELLEEHRKTLVGSGDETATTVDSNGNASSTMAER